MCFLFLGDEFSATALLSEAARIKNTYTDGTKLYAYRIKYTTRDGTPLPKHPNYIHSFLDFSTATAA